MPTLQGLTVEQQLNFICKVLQFFDGSHTMTYWLNWNADEGNYKPVQFYVHCGSLFSHRGPDQEPITPDNFHLLAQSFDDVMRASIEDDQLSFVNIRVVGLQLFCCRSRKRRPRPDWFKPVEWFDNSIKAPSPAIAALFEAAGPPPGEDPK